MKRAIVFGAGGFIGSHLVTKLKELGFFVRGVDLKYPEFSNTKADEFIIGDLRELKFVQSVIDNTFDELYQLASDMGGAGYVFSGENDANIMYNSSQINLNVAIESHKINKLFYSSSACVYNNPICEEYSAYPANPDNEYGWEKLFSERLYSSFNKNYGLNLRIARFHTIFGIEGVYDGGKEKAVSAICRKVINCENNGSIEIWGDGEQTRSMLYIDDCVNRIIKLMNSDYIYPVNIGSEEMISINNLAKMIIEISGKNINIINVKGPEGVRGRNSHNTLYKSEVGEITEVPLRDGVKKTYDWIYNQIKNNKNL